MRIKLFALMTVFVLVSMLLASCGPAATPAVPTAEVIEKTVVQTQIVEVTAMPGPNPEAVIEGVEDGAEITIWTFWLSPTFDDYIHSTIARFNEAYPGVKVNWEDHQASFQDDLKAAFAAGTAPDVINLSVGEGWVSDYATQGLLLPLDDVVPQDVKDVYFENLWNQQLVDGKNYQFPWYNFVGVELINTQIYTGTPQTDADGKITYSGGADLKVEDFPKTVQELPALCKTIKEKTGKLCDIRLTVNDLLAQMVYEGDVKVYDEAAGNFTFDSPEAVEWLNMYVGMVKDGTVDKSIIVAEQDRDALNLFTTGQAPFYQTGPNLIRVVRENNPGLYGYLAVAPQPVGKSGVAAKGGMGISVNASTKYPNASIALAQFFTNPQSMVEFAKVVSVYPSSPAAYDDPFFSAKPVAIEDMAKPAAKEYISKLADIVPLIPQKGDVNAIVLRHIQDALFNNVDTQTALTEAVAEANALIGK
ncbi:MAG TPA: sugar ABC transporter substrate-binding protein [Anaerolineales bacterium]|nr:sugar ABC transporter substrate-binding protein [Anaerolineales bacterium]